MESLQSIIERAEFKEAFRGYDRTQVDTFLDKLASRNWIEAGPLGAAPLPGTSEPLPGGGTLHHAPATPLPAAVEVPIEVPPVVAEEGPDAAEAWRVLLLAERTAAQAVATANDKAASLVQVAEQDSAEAKRVAEKVLADAKREADKMLADSREKAAATLDAAHADATSVTEAAAKAAQRTMDDAQALSRREAADARAALQEQLDGLAAQRDTARADLAALQLHVTNQREAVQTAALRLKAVADDPSVFHVAPAPPPPSTVPAPRVL